MLLQQTIYCGVPAANSAFRHLGEVFEELRGEGVKINRAGGRRQGRGISGKWPPTGERQS